MIGGPPLVISSIADNKEVNVQTYINCINIDSSLRKRCPTYIFDEALYSLPPYPLHFTTGSSVIDVYFTGPFVCHW